MGLSLSAAPGLVRGSLLDDGRPRPASSLHFRPPPQLQGDDSRKNEFPFVQTEPDGRQAVWVAPSLLLALHETVSELTIFLEKDYASNLKLSKRDLVRQLLAAVAAIAGDTPVVRLRDRDDPDRWALMDCW